MPGPSDIRAGRATIELDLDPKYKKKLDDAGKDVDTFGKKIDGVKKKFGEGSDLDKLGKLAVGTGAIAGVTFLASALNKATASAAQMVDEFRRGERDALGLAEGVAKNLPVIGQVASATENVIDIFTGWKSEVDRVNDSIAETEKRMAKVAERAATLAAARKNLEEVGQKIADDRDTQRGPPMADFVANRQRYDAVVNQVQTGTLEQAKKMLGMPDGSQQNIYDRVAQLRKRQGEIANELSIPANIPKVAIGGNPVSRELSKSARGDAIKAASDRTDALKRERDRINKTLADAQPLIDEANRQMADAYGFMVQKNMAAMAKVYGAEVSKWLSTYGSGDIAKRYLAGLWNGDKYWILNKTPPVSNQPTPFVNGWDQQSDRERRDAEFYRRNGRMPGNNGAIPFLSDAQAQNQTQEEEMRKRQRELDLREAEAAGDDAKARSVRRQIDREQELEKLRGIGVVGQQAADFVERLTTLQDLEDRRAAGVSSSIGTFNPYAAQALQGGGSPELAKLSELVTAMASANTTLRRIDNNTAEGNRFE